MKEIRKAAIRLSMLTKTDLSFYLEMPVQDFVELNNEVAEEWQKVKRWN